MCLCIFLNNRFRKGAGKSLEKGPAGDQGVLSCNTLRFFLLSDLLVTYFLAVLCFFSLLDQDRTASVGDAERTDTLTATCRRERRRGSYAHFRAEEKETNKRRKKITQQNTE